MEKLHKIILENSKLANGKNIRSLNLFYQTFGAELGSAPVVVVNHALTGNSNVAGENGWWNVLIGDGKTINTAFFSIIAFNIPGNGYDGEAENLIANYRDYTARDIAYFFWKGLVQLNISNVFAIIGGSLGGGIAWEMAALKPKSVQNLIPIATDWKATDWVIANVLVQDRILNNSDDPIADARMHAMLLYRTPESLGTRFNREKNASGFKIEKWLQNHGNKLQQRFRLSSYKLMNHLLKTVDISRGKDFHSVANQITSAIHIVSVNSDYFYTPDQNRETFQELRQFKADVHYHEIQSIHGHDAFLIELDQLAKMLSPIFTAIQKAV